MVKCRECGFLAVRDQLGEVCEAARDTREKGSRRDYSGHPGCPSLFCYRGSAAFPAVPTNPIQEIAAAIDKEIDCPTHTPWLEGRSPKEHVEMDLIEQQRAWQRDENARHDARENLRDRRQMIGLGIAAIGLVAGPLLTLLVSQKQQITVQPATPTVIVQPATPTVIVQPPARGSAQP